MQTPLARPVAAFILLGFLLSWYPWLLKLAGSGGDGGPNPLGLLLAAVILAARRGRWPAVREFLSRIVRLNAGWRAWALALAATPLVLAVAIAVARVAGIEAFMPVLRWQDQAERFLFILLFIGLGEEPAWRGYLQPLLQQRMSPLKAALAVGAVWGAWHLPLMGGEFAWRDVPAFLASVFAAAVVLAATVNLSAGRSVLPAMVLHTLVNVLVPPVLQALPAGDLARFWWIYAGCWALLAMVVATAMAYRAGGGNRQ